LDPHGAGDSLGAEPGKAGLEWPRVKRILQEIGGRTEVIIVAFEQFVRAKASEWPMSARSRAREHPSDTGLRRLSDACKTQDVNPGSSDGPEIKKRNAPA
jgi:hypothetical protein